MIPTIFLGLMCLGTLTAMEDDMSWLPTSVPWPSQQCIDKGRGYVGECSAVHNDPSYKNVPLCRSLKCALPKYFDNGYALQRVGRPMDGTVCGVLKACYEGICVDIPPYSIPTQTGVRTTYECGAPFIRPRPRTQNSTRPVIRQRKTNSRRDE